MTDSLPRKSIQHQLLRAMLVTSLSVMLLTCATFLIYEVVTFRTTMARQLSIRAKVLAANCTGSLAFQNPEDASDVINALRADPNITAAAIYDENGELFAHFPPEFSSNAFPPVSTERRPRFADGSLRIFTPVTLNGRTLGTFFIQSSLRAMEERFRIYAFVVLLVMAGTFIPAWIISHRFLRRISEPILSLAQTVQQVSNSEDYSARARKFENDELGQLADGFNAMIARVQARDASLRDSEQRLRAMADAAPQIVWTATPEGALDYYNQRWYDYTGLTFEETQGWGWKAVLHPDDLQRCIDTWSQCVSTGSPYHIEYRFKRAMDGTYRWHLGRALPIRGADGRIVRWFGTGTDIDDQKRALAQIEMLNAELEKRVLDRTSQLAAANNELEAFCYSVSHDLRAPLRHIDGFIQLLAKSGDTLSEKNLRYLNIIAGSAREMGRLIDDLLVFSRMGRTELRHATVELNQLCAETIRSLEPDIGNRNIQWIRNDLPVVQGDFSMLRQVFANLLGNAIKYSRDRDPAVIEIGSDSTHPSEWIIFVRDNGVGFDMLYADKLFGVFQRLHSSEEFEGTGIGLANVNRIITRHGGRCWAESQVNKGATFYFSLPRLNPH